MAAGLIQIERQEWLEARRKGIGGSDVAAVFNEEYGCERQLWYDKRGQSPDYSIGEDRQQLFDRGHELEDAAAELYARRSGRKIRRMPMRFSKADAFMLVNVDRQIVNDERGPGVLEIKTANHWAFRKIQKEGLPHSYILQMQHAFAVTGYQWGSFAVLHPDSWSLAWFDYGRDEELIAIIREKESIFWAKVENGPIPDPLALGDRRCSECIFRKTCRGQQLLEQLPDADREAKAESDDSIAEVVADFRQAKQMREEAELLEKSVRMKLETALGDRAAVEVPSVGVRVLFRSQDGRTMVDNAALKSKFPDVYAQVQKKSAPSRPLRLYEL